MLHVDSILENSLLSVCVGTSKRKHSNPENYYKLYALLIENPGSTRSEGIFVQLVHANSIWGAHTPFGHRTKIGIEYVLYGGKNTVELEAE